MTKQEIQLISREVAKELFKLLQCDTLLKTKDAAALLGVSERWMRDNKNRFDYVKTGKNDGGEILFRKSSLLQGVSA